MTHEEFTRLAQKYIHTVYRAALSCLASPSDADDVTQNTFLKLLRSEKSFESDEHVKAWLIRVAINECKRVFSSPWRRTESIEDYAAALTFPSPESGEVFRLMMGLPKKYRVPLYLYYHEGCATAEIAEILGVPRSTVCTQLARGRAALKNYLLEADDYE